jgi:hypothetical protein
LISNPVLGGFGWGRPEAAPQKIKKKLQKIKRNFAREFKRILPIS